jgi:hypothetical protein
VDGSDTSKVTDCDAQFTDPDGEPYVWNVQADATKADENKLFQEIENSRKNVGEDAVDHQLYVIPHSGCGVEEQTYTYDTGARNFTLMYRLEGGSTSCNDNH